MNLLPDTYLANVALHALVLSAMTWGILRLIRRAGHRSFIAIAGLLATAVLPWATAFRSPEEIKAPAFVRLEETPALPAWTVITMPATTIVSTPVGPAHAVVEFLFPADPLQVMFIVWTTGTSAGLGMLGFSLFRLFKWRRTLASAGDLQWSFLAAVCPAALARADFLISSTPASPCVTGFVRPLIVMPSFLLDGDHKQQLRWAVNHEATHLRAGDSRWMILFSLIRCVNWWNPFVHRLVSQWSDAREQVCDLAATGASGDRAKYARFLVTMAGRIPRQPRLAVAMAKRLHARRLKQRLVCLLEARTGHAQPVGKAFIGFSSVLFLTGAVLVSALRIGAEETAGFSETIPEAIPEVESGMEQMAPDPAPQPLPSPAPQSRKSPEPRSVLRWAAVPQLKLSTKLILTPSKPALKDGEVLSDQQVQLQMRNLSQQKGVNLMTAPAGASRSGEQMEIQIIRNVPRRGGQKAAGGTAPFVGITLTMASNVIGNAVDLKFDADYRFVPGGPVFQFSKEEVEKMNPDDIKTVKHTITSRLAPGQTAVSDLGEIEPGKFLYILVSAAPINKEGELLDAYVGGKPLDPAAVGKDAPDKQEARPFRISPKAESGKVRLNAVLIDLPRDPTLPADQRYFKKLSPAAEDSLNALVKHHRLEKRKLKQVEIPLNGPHVPWPEFPEIRLSAVATPDLSQFALTNDSEQNGTSSVTPMSPGAMVHIDVRSGDPAIERRVYITVIPVK